MKNFLRSYSIELILMGVLLAAVSYFAYLGYGLITVNLDRKVSGAEALIYVSQQLEYGPRTTGSDASEAMVEWLANELVGRQDWRAVVQPYNVLAPVIYAGQAITTSTPDSQSNLAMVQLMGRNLIAIRPAAGKARDGDPPVAILATPYDSRVLADADPDVNRHTESSPGANAGASGVAVLLELARTLTDTGHTVCLVFLDSEANRGVPGWPPPYGGQHFIEEFGDQIIEEFGDQTDRCAEPEFAVVLESAGGVEHQLRIDGGSDPLISAAIWRTAADLGFGDYFLNEVGPAVSGAHNTFIEAGIPTVLISESGYPHRDATTDTLDKVSAESLERVGRTLQTWLEQGAPFE